MTTAATTITRARVDIRDESSEFFTSDATLVNKINDILENIYSRLCFVESNIVYKIGSVTTTADTAEYSLGFSFNSIDESNGVWISGNDTYLYPISEEDKIKYDYINTTTEPEAFYITEDSKIGFMSVPNDTFGIYIKYWEKLTALTGTSGTLPWSGIFDRYVHKMLVVELLEIMERDNSRASILAGIEWNTAINTILKRGTKDMSQRSGMFSVEGI